MDVGRPDGEDPPRLQGCMGAVETGGRVEPLLVGAVEATLRTNVFVEQRFALALRLDPGLMAAAHDSGEPFGVFFVHGRGFDGFHVRFRDIARGGVRVVRALGPGEHGRESVRLRAMRR